jgi:hypothetical protein
LPTKWNTFLKKTIFVNYFFLVLITILEVFVESCPKKSGSKDGSKCEKNIQRVNVKSDPVKLRREEDKNVGQKLKNWNILERK